MNEFGTGSRYSKIYDKENIIYKMNEILFRKEPNEYKAKRFRDLLKRIENGSILKEKQEVSYE